MPLLKRITVELEETFGGGNDNYIEVERELLISMEYQEDMLVVEYYKSLLCADKTHRHVRCVEILSKARVKRLTFDEEGVDSRLPFPKYDNQPIQEL